MSNKETRRGRPPVTVPELRRTYGQLDDDERLSYVAKAFCEGKTPSQIAPLLSEHFGEEIRREEPYRLLQLGALRGYFHYSPPLEARLGERICQAWRSVREAHVVKTQVLEDVAMRAAEVLLALIRDAWASKRKAHEKTGDPDEVEADTVRIGLAGGRTVLLIVRKLAELLKRTDPEAVPGILRFHTACTGIHYNDLSTDPNAFVTHLLRVDGVGTKTFAVPFQAPPNASRELREMLAKQKVMRDAKTDFELVDIVVTGGASWRTSELADPGDTRHASASEGTGADAGEVREKASSQLKKLMEKHDDTGYKKLLDAGTVADMLWQPLGFAGPVEIDTDVQAMTLQLLRDLPRFIEKDRKVLFVLGPYWRGTCHKGDVLFAALGGSSGAEGAHGAGPLFTHLVCDHRTARAALEADGG